MLAEITLIFIWTGGLTLTYLTSRATNDDVVNAMLRCFDFLLQVGKVITDVAFLPVSVAVSLPWVWVLRLSFLSSIGLLVHQSPTLLLETLDTMWRSVVYPFVKVGMLNVLMVFRFFFGTFAPLYNLVVVISEQIRTGSLTLAGKCSIGNIRTGTTFLTKAIVSFLRVTSLFMVQPSTEYNITQSMWELQQAVHVQSETAQCMCLSLSQPVEVFFGLTKSPSLARGINAGFNIGVSLLQRTVVSALNPLQAPDFYRTFQYMKGTADHFGEWIDDVLIDSSRIMLDIDVEFPQEFVFVTASHLVKSVVEVANVAVGTTAHIVWRTKDVEKMIRVTSLQYAFEELDFFVDGTGTIVTWVLDNVLTVIDQVCRECPDISSVQSVAAGDLVRWSGRSLLGVPYVATNLINELMWRWNEKNAEGILRMLQDHDGEWGSEFDRGVVFKSKKPSLNRNVFYPFEKLIDAFVVFVPSDVAPLKALPRSVLQLFRIAIRVVLSGNHIIEGTFSKNPIDYDYGTDGNTNGVQPQAGGDECGLTKGHNCQCMFVFPDDDVRTNKNLQDFYGRFGLWCNSLLYEFVFKELDDLQQGLANMIKLLTPSECTTRITWQGEPTCETIDAYDDPICAVSDLVGAASRVPLNLIRHVYAILITEFFDVDEVHFKYEKRLCDFSDLLYKTLGVLPFTAKQTYVDAAYALLRAFSESQRAVVYFVDFLSERGFNWNSKLKLVPCEGCDVPDINTSDFVALVMVELHLFFSYFVTLFETFADMFGDQGGFHSVFKALAETTRLVKKAVSKDFIDMFALIVETVIDLFLVLFGAGPSPDFSTNVGDLLKKIVRSLLVHVPQIMSDLIFEALGPLGTELKNFLDSVDFSGLEEAGTTLFDTIFGASVGGETTMMDIYDIGWHGTSECDTMIHAYRHYTLGDMRPLEHLTVLKCMEQRELAVKLGEVIGVELPHDMVYNWQRKFEMLYSGTTAAIVYYKHHSSRQLVQEWQNHQLQPYWLQIFTGTGTLLRHISIRDFVNGVHHSLGYNPHVATFINVVDDTLDTVGQIRDAWTYHNVSHSWRSLHGIADVTYTLGTSAYQVHQYVVVDIAESPSQYAWGIHADTGGSCALVDNFNRTVVEQLKIVQDYYTNDYVTMVDEFMAWFQGRDPWVTDFLRKFELALKNKYRVFEGKVLTPEGFLDPQIDFEQLKTYFKINFEASDIDLEIKFQSVEFQTGWRISDLQNPLDTEFFKRQEASTNPRYDEPTLLLAEDDCLFETNFPQDILKAFSCFVTKEGVEADIPYFGHNLRYILDYQFQKCIPSQIKCDSTERRQRLDRMVSALWYCLLAIIIATALQTLLGVSTMMYIPLPLVFFIIIATHVWNWTYTCAPNVPICLADDIYYFVQTFLVPDCFCTYFPALSINCFDGCQFISGNTAFNNCTQGLFEDDEFKYVWVSFFYAKQYVPAVLKALGSIVYESHFQSLVPLVSEPNTQLEIDCAQLHVLDLSYPLLGTLLVLYTLPEAFALILRLSAALLNLMLALANLIYTMFLSLDQTTARVRAEGT